MVTIAALVIFVVYETIKTLLFPGMSVIVSHVVTVIVVAVMTFYVSRYGFERYSAALAEINRQTEMTEETNRLLSGVLATMREGVLIVNSDMRIVLYNDAASRVMKLPSTRKERSHENGSGKASGDISVFSIISTSSPRRCAQARRCNARPSDQQRVSPRAFGSRKRRSAS